MAHGSSELFEVFGIGITSHMTTMAAITVGLGLVSYFATRNMKTVPAGLQNVMETVVEKLENFFSGVIGAKEARAFLPYLGTMFLFIILSNYSGLLPMAGSLPGLAAPTSILSVTVGLAVVTFLVTHVSGFRRNKLGYFKHFISPMVIMLPFAIIEEIVRPLSLSLRLYGNIFGEETVAHEMFSLIPLFVPLPFMVLGVLFGALQALVFTMLSSIYIKGAVGGH